MIQLDAYGCIFAESSAEAREQADILLGAGWSFEIPSAGAEPWQWAWRAPAKRKGKPGKRWASTNQAYNALQRSINGPKLF